MIALPPPPSLSGDDWPEEILEDAKVEFNCTITVLDPTTTVETPYDPETGEGGDSVPLVVIADRPARAQHIRLPLDGGATGELVVQRRYLFQCEILPDDPSIDKGMILRVTGGRDPKLATFAFEVHSSGNSSHAALRTIRTLTEEAAVPQ